MNTKRIVRYALPGLALGIILFGVTASAYWWGQQNIQAESTTTQLHDDSIQTTAEIRDTLPATDPSKITDGETMTQALQYLVEEEKLAHDVYQKLYEMWGSRNFSNIKQSELSHQANVLAVMETRDISDPRIDQSGKFANPDLQKLYDQLVIQGSKNPTEAQKVGVAIEELDIADLKRMLAAVPEADADVSAMMQRLLEGSQRHLQAFNRQLSRL